MLRSSRLCTRHRSVEPLLSPGAGTGHCLQATNPHTPRAAPRLSRHAHQEEASARVSLLCPQRSCARRRKRGNCISPTSVPVSAGVRGAPCQPAACLSGNRWFVIVLGRGASTLRTVPVPGYCGFVPGIASGNKHGMTYGALLTKDTIRSPSGQRQRTPESPGGGASPFGRATAIGLIREGAPVDVPVVGYMGFIPGFTSKNLHGGTYRSLLSTPSSPMGSPLRSPSPDRECPLQRNGNCWVRSQYL